MSVQLALPQRFLRTKEAAVVLGLSSRTLERHRTYGTGPKYSKVGGRVLYAPSNLTEWAERDAKRSTSDPQTVLPAKPADHVTRVKQIPDNAIIVKLKAATPVMIGTSEAARFLGLSVQTLAKHRTYGTGPKYQKVGRRILYAEADLTEWAARGAKCSTSDPETVRPAKPVHQVRRVKQVPDHGIIFEVEAAQHAKPADQANLVESVPDSAIIAEVEIAEPANPAGNVDLAERIADGATTVEDKAGETTKRRTPGAAHYLASSRRPPEGRRICRSWPKRRLPFITTTPLAAGAGDWKLAICSRRRGAPIADPARIVPILQGWPSHPASRKARAKSERRPVGSKRLWRRRGQDCPRHPGNSWEHHHKPGDLWRRRSSMHWGTAHVEMRA